MVAQPDRAAMPGSGGPVPPTNGQQTINGMIAAPGDHAIYLELLVGVAGFEPAASSSRSRVPDLGSAHSRIQPGPECPSASAGVRGCVAIVTQLVTQPSLRVQRWPARKWGVAAARGHAEGAGLPSACCPAGEQDGLMGVVVTRIERDGAMQRRVVGGAPIALLPALPLACSSDRRPVRYAFTLAAPGAHTSHAREGGLAWDSSIG